MQKWERLAAESNLRVFPINIRQDASGKWDKVPLIERWQDEGNFYKLTSFDWSRANGYGILMGHGYYGLDLDLYKEGNDAEQWFDTHKVIRETRTHRTISGGIHRIYAVRTDLPTRSNIVKGLDGRGIGGFLAFGEGYEMIDSSFPTMLPTSAREDIATGTRDAKIEGVSALVEGWRPEMPPNGEAELQKALRFGPRLLIHRWQGNNIGLHDKSRSAMDHSVGKLLAIAGCSEDLIVWALLCRFEHGAARWKPNPKVSVRAAARSTLKGTAQVAEGRALIDYFQQPEMSDAEQLAMEKALRGES